MFQVSWTVTDAEWSKAKDAAIENAPGSDYDRGGLAFYYLLNGLVEIKSKTSTLFHRGGSNACYISIFDLAAQLVFVLSELKKSGHAQICQGDDSLEIYFASKDGVVTVRSNRGPDEVAVPFNEFIEGCQEFLRQFAGTLFERIPQFLKWTSIAPIAAFAPS